ncbi:hypothetical protein ACT453_42755, partial [Bacillus sp. D-CC]
SKNTNETITKLIKSPVLYVVYAITTGLAFALADLINLRVHAFGFIELITRTPMMVNAGLTRDLINFVIVSLTIIGVRVINLRVHAFGFIELITRTPMMVNA